MRVLLAGLLIGVAALHAQTAGAPPPPPATGVIVGQAVDATSGAPIAGALVTLSPAPPGIDALDSGDSIPMDQFMNINLASMFSGVRQAIADGQGRFAFTGVTSGTFSLDATKPGYSGGEYGQRRSDGAASPLVLAADGRAGDVVLPLWKNAAMSGRVVDEAGDPIVGVTVRVLTRTWLAGRPRYAAAGAGTTDDRGLYRVGALRPGEYVAVIPQTPVTMAAVGGALAPPDSAAVQSMIAPSGAGSDSSALLASVDSLMGTSSGTGLRVGDWVLRTSGIGGRLIPPATADAGRMSAYRTTFYPGASSFSQAVAIPIASGEDRPIVDFQLRPVPVVQISGTVAKPDGDTRTMQVRLVPSGSEELASDIGFEAATSTTTAAGAFAFLAVPPGQYTIRILQAPAIVPFGGSIGFGMPMIENAQGNRAVSIGPMTMDMVMPVPPAITAEPTLWAAQPITVGDRDVTGITVPLRAGYRISGRVEFDGTSPKPSADQLQRIPIVLDRADTPNPTANELPMMGAASTGRFDENGRFTTYGVVPGKYFVRMPFGFGGWTFKSAMLAGRDVSDQPLEIESADVTGVTLTLSDRRSELAGALKTAEGQPAAGGSVVAFPVQRDRWLDFGSSPRRLRVTKATPDGRYRIQGLPAGNYFVAATVADVAGDWQNPAFLETLSRMATRVTIGEGERKVVDLAAR